MNELITKVTAMLGAVASSVLGYVLLGLLILIVRLIIVKFITGIFGKTLSRVDVLTN